MAPGPSRAQAGGRLPSQLALGLDEDGLVDRLVRRPPLWLARESVRSTVTAAEEP